MDPQLTGTGSGLALAWGVARPQSSGGTAQAEDRNLSIFTREPKELQAHSAGLPETCSGLQRCGVKAWVGARPSHKEVEWKLCSAKLAELAHGLEVPPVPPAAR